ncbi:hypothetical protein TTY48_33260 [Tsukamurella sp. TY48]|nr:hypothetical protein TTY48_33260 [Tsukamurella sp. TY48]
MLTLRRFGRVNAHIMTAAPAIRSPDAGTGPARPKVCSDNADEVCVLTALTSMVDDDSKWLRRRMTNDTSLCGFPSGSHVGAHAPHSIVT